MRTSWHVPEALPLLSKGQIHVWYVERADFNAANGLDLKCFSKAELLRASKFYFERDRNTFLSARYLLRHLLAHYLQRAAGEFTFSFNEYGKPYLAEEPMYFNISHSGSSIAVAFTALGPIGVDIEQLRDIDYLKLASRFFAKKERIQLSSYQEEDRQMAFYRCWARKEAFIKAIGKGVSLPLDQFAISLDDDRYPSLIDMQWAPDQIPEWTLESFDLKNGTPGALAIQSGEIETKYFQVNNLVDCCGEC